MKLLTAAQIREWDAYTIRHEPIRSIDLMERAATACAEHIIMRSYKFGRRSLKIFCGNGNNGGDGLVIARHLAEQGAPVEVYILKSGKSSADFLVNEKNLHEQGEVDIYYLEPGVKLPLIAKSEIVIDAIFGTGLSKPVEGLAAEVINHINNHATYVISVDVPSGLPAEINDVDELRNRIIIEADVTLTFQVPKLSFLLPDTYRYVGDFEVLDIGLHQGYQNKAVSSNYYIDKESARGLLKPRSKFSHKGVFGHVLMVGGSYGKMGAITLTSKAALRTGCGLCTVYIPKVGYTILQTALPEVMTITDEELYTISTFPEAADFSALGVGPGLGTHEKTVSAFGAWLSGIRQPLVIDADGLNGCAALLKKNKKFRFPSNAILTPHPKEFDRLAGASHNGFERLRRQADFAKEHEVIVVLKGAHTSIAMPDGALYFNSSGNDMLATGGSGDVLTGIITSFLAQGYSPADAAVIGVYLHGLCADLWLEKGNRTMIASDIVTMLPETLHYLENA